MQKSSIFRHLGTVFDQSLGDDGIGVLVGLIEARHAVALSAFDPDARRAAVIDELVHYFGAAASRPIGYVEQDWLTERWSLGGYAAHMPPGVITGYGDALREPCGRITGPGPRPRPNSPDISKGRCGPASGPPRSCARPPENGLFASAAGIARLFAERSGLTVH